MENTFSQQTVLVTAFLTCSIDLLMCKVGQRKIVDFAYCPSYRCEVEFQREAASRCQLSTNKTSFAGSSHSWWSRQRPCKSSRRNYSRVCSHHGLRELTSKWSCCSSCPSCIRETQNGRCYVWPSLMFLPSWLVLVSDRWIQFRSLFLLLKHFRTLVDWTFDSPPFNWVGMEMCIIHALQVHIQFSPYLSIESRL